MWVRRQIGCSKMMISVIHKLCDVNESIFIGVNDEGDEVVQENNLTIFTSTVLV